MYTSSTNDLKSLCLINLLIEFVDSDCLGFAWGFSGKLSSMLNYNNIMQWLFITSFQIDFHIVCSICLFTAIVNGDAIVVVMIFNRTRVEWQSSGKYLWWYTLIEGITQTELSAPQSGYRNALEDVENVIKSSYTIIIAFITEIDSNKSFNKTPIPTIGNQFSFVGQLT